MERLGGQILRDETKPGKPVSQVTLLGKEVTDADLKDLAGFKELDWLTLNNTEVTDAGLKELAQFKQLTALSLRGTKVTDAGLKELAPLKGLIYLNLGSTEITDAGLKELAPLKGLKHAPSRRYRGDGRRGQGTCPTQGTDDPRQLSPGPE